MAKIEKLTAAHEIIIEGVQKIGGRQKWGSDYVMVQCPFHEENTPSCGIYLASGMSIPIGMYNCFGCGSKGPWNKIAEKLKLATIKEWSTYDTGIAFEGLEKSIESLDALIENMKISAIQWPEGTQWRGFDSNIIRKVGGLMAYEKLRDTNDLENGNISVLFPIYYGRSLKGGVKASYRKTKFSLPYVTTKGNWVGKYGLLGYNTCKELGKDYVVLVEGPRDALRLLDNNIPAIAVLGSNNFNHNKATMLSSLCAKTVYCLPDNDEAGNALKQRVKKEMSALCKTIAIKLPKHCKDPEQLDADDIDNLKDMIDN